MKLKWKAMAVGVGFGAAIGFIFGAAAGIVFQDLGVAAVVGAAVTGFSLDVLFNGSRCK